MIILKMAEEPIIKKRVIALEEGISESDKRKKKSRNS